MYRTICFRNLLTFRSSRHFNTQFEQQCLLPRLYSYLQSYTTFHMRYIRQIQRAICIMSLNGRLPFFPSLLPPSFHICRTNVLSFGVDKKKLGPTTWHILKFLTSMLFRDENREMDWIKIFTHKLHHQGSICWCRKKLFWPNGLCIFFLFVKIDSWNFQHLFDLEFRET